MPKRELALQKRAAPTFSASSAELLAAQMVATASEFYYGAGMHMRLLAQSPSVVRVVMVIGALSVNAAMAKDLDPQTRENVIASCSTDAYRLCPQSLANEKDAINCMSTKRRELGQICRVAYTKAVRILAQ